MSGTRMSILRNHNAEDSVIVRDFFMSFTPFNMFEPEYKSAAPQIDWTITEEHKQIGGIEVTKATGRVYGRDWTVWFAESIPFFEGPWELTGAPGLILEAYDNSGNHQFTLEEMVPINTPIVVDKKSRKEMTRDEYRKYRGDHVAAELAKKKRGDIASDTFSNFLDLE